jgi:hypothetical protein
MQQQQLKTFEFSNGRSVKLKTVSPLTLSRVRKQYRPPKPPLNEVDYGDGSIMEPNPADPDYIEAMEMYEMELNERMQRLTIKLSVVHTLSDDEKEELAAFREVLASEGIDVEADDMEAYINHLCISSGDDLRRFLEAVTNTVGPSAEGVQAVKEQFPS